MKGIVSVLLAVLFLFAFSSVAHAQITKDQYYARSTLAGNELEYYDDLYTIMQNGYGLNGDEYGISEERSYQIAQFIYCDCPELFTRKELYTDEDARELQSQIDIITADILKNITDDMTDYDKAKTMYDYLGSYIFYGYGSNLRDEKTVYETQTIVGGLINKKAICGGISSTLQYLLYQADIPCFMVEGTNNEGAHGWNIIQIDGQWYYADLTYDIANVKRGDPWEAFLISDETLHSLGTYASTDNPPLPECPEDYKEPQPTPMPTPAQAEPVQANIPDEPENAAEDFAKSAIGGSDGPTAIFIASKPNYLLWALVGGAAIAAVVIILLVRTKKKS